ncbi:uncharacterized protein BKA78DRAFT_129565 [Phyllosticta capitalensis]|uniref:uncharacterized protein n=1 Tax=Phyllosticta capitalensis TaxID=121624 RepID=UPI0031305DCC
MEPLIVALTIIAGLLAIDICLRVFEVTGHGFSRHAPRNNAAPHHRNNSPSEVTESELRTTQNRSSFDEHATLRIVEDTKPSRVPDATPTDRPGADTEPNDTPHSLVDQPSDTIEIQANNERPKNVEKPGNRKLQRRLGSETVFRLSGLPINHNGSYFDEIQTKAVIGRAFSVDETAIFVDSLANMPASQCQMATIRFSNVPLEVERKINSDGQLTVICRASENATEGLTLFLDVHFESFTPLYSPRNPDLE